MRDVVCCGTPPARLKEWRKRVAPYTDQIITRPKAAAERLDYYRGHKSCSGQSAAARFLTYDGQTGQNRIEEVLPTIREHAAELPVVYVRHHSWIVALGGWDRLGRFRD